MTDRDNGPTRSAEGTSVTEDPGTETSAELEAELGFEPYDSGAAEPVREPSRERSRVVRRAGRVGAAGQTRPRHTALRRKLSATAVLMGALFAVGGGYAMFASSSSAAESTATQAAISQGRQLYNISCIACHGANLQGVLNKGPTLVGSGGAHTYFLVATGRMPAYGQDAEIGRRAPKFDDAQAKALSAYVQSIGGGPAIPTGQLPAKMN